ncbi:hypothetical protein F4780DRAFT_758972 [Xylariomycetidae sp. FL0641]|nr:hypothetical protein F4780DRAFT_758972 [Xylariomycetidae sp. FL0641]
MHFLDKLNKHGSSWHSNSNPAPTQDARPPSPPSDSTPPAKVNGNAASPAPSSAPAPTSTPSSQPAGATAPPSTAQSIPSRPTPKSRSQSNDSQGSAGTPPQRKGSWFSSISSKFSGSPANTASPPTDAVSQDDNDDVAPLPKITPNKNAVLPHASRQTGDAPYVPAPPRSSQPGFLGVLRRLSSSNSAAATGTKASHGLVERRILNVDKNRERCRVNELSQGKLRRVAFCVDVEIAPMPRYTEDEEEPAACKKPADKSQKKKLTEKSEGAALKNPTAAKEQKEDEVAKGTGESLPKEPPKEGAEPTNGHTKESSVTTETEEPKPEKETKEPTRKKEKKKKSEAERKAKKEQKRRDALEKGAIPMEIHLDSDSSQEDLTIRAGTPRPQYTPTTNPARIYRRCCQLRETDILTKITLQLPKTTENCHDGIVEKLDLTGYLLSLPDLVTLGDFLAVVPIREVILENCGLSDEGMRVILAGLLAARKPSAKARRQSKQPADLIAQGGVVERLVLKNNKIGVEGWRHICLFIHMCRTIKCLDLSSLQFPAPKEQVKSPLNHHNHLHLPHINGHQSASSTPIDISLLLSKSLGERLAGPELELLNLGATGLSASQLGAIVDGALKSGVSRIGLSHNHLDSDGVQHVARYLRNAACEGIDLGGNDLRDHLDSIAEAIGEKDELWALSLANCNLKPASLCKLFPKLLLLPNFKFLDLSHNHDLFESEPSAIGLLRRYLPGMDNLKRLHLADVSMSSEQAIALAEVLPEVKTLAHLNLLENPSLVQLADARTEDDQEEACALYASLLAAVRVSKTLVKLDIDTPTPESGELLRALANRIVAFCMMNLQGVTDLQNNPDGETSQKLEKYPDVLRHLIGHEDDSSDEDLTDDTDAAPDEDYVIGGTGVAKALACVLKNRGEDNRQQSDELTREPEAGTATSKAQIPPGKAKDMSKHLLATARKIRVRLQPALASAKASAREDINDYNRLVFLDQTIQGMIKRFEDEFPDCREGISHTASPRTTPSDVTPPIPEINTSLAPFDHDPAVSDTEEIETELKSPSRSRSNSIMSHTSKAFAEEEGRVLRAGHKFRRSFMTQDEFNILNSVEELGNDPSHVRMISGLMDDLMEDDEEIRKRVEQMGAVRAFEADKDNIWKRLRDKDPQYWDRFLESQEKARANIKVSTEAKNNGLAPQQKPVIVDEEAISD